MAQVINLNNYRASKQRELVVSIYQYLNEGLDYRLDNILIDFDEAFIDVCNQYNMNPVTVNYFRLPIITFIVTTFAKNSEISHQFPKSFLVDNEANKTMFKNTLIKVLETFEKNYRTNPDRNLIELEVESIVDEGLNKILKSIPENIYLV